MERTPRGKEMSYQMFKGWCIGCLTLFSGYLVYQSGSIGKIIGIVLSSFIGMRILYQDAQMEKNKQ